MSSSTLQIPTPRVFLPLLKPARYKGAHGGRGSGKSHFFAELLIEACLAKTTRAVCIREVQKSIKQSVKLLIEDKIQAHKVGDKFTVLDDRIEGKNGSLIIFQGMQDHTADSIKSLEGFDIAYVEEAQSLSERSLRLLRPTIRKEGSELWFAWNPENEDDPVDLLLRGSKKLEDAVVVEANWRNNPWFPLVLKNELEADKQRDMDNYLHVWEGHYKIALEGAVFADQLREAKDRIINVPYVDGKPVNLYWDLGDADGCAVWYQQKIGFEHRFMDYHFASHKKLGYHIEEVKKRGYSISTIWLPHDAVYEQLSAEKNIKTQIEEAFPNADVRVIEAAGKPGSLNTGINLARNIFSQCYFDKARTAEGIKALRHWHYKKDEVTGRTSLKPVHDWSSHGSMAFVYFAMAVEEVSEASDRSQHLTEYCWMG